MQILVYGECATLNINTYAKIDYKSCFDSIYTHAYKWIVERNVIDSKEARNSNLFITIDRILQNINGRSSNGLIVGPEFSRMIAEVLLQQIDSEILLALSNEEIERDKDYVAFRYVDDIFLFANSQENLNLIIEKYRIVGEKYRIRLNELKLVKGETPCLPKSWLEKTRHLSDVMDKFFYKGKKSDFNELPEEERFLIKSDFIQVDRVKDEITTIMKECTNDRRTIVSYLLSTLLNNISKKKDGYTLFGKTKIGKAMLLIDIALFVYAFCPSFDQTRKIISIIVYMDNEIFFKKDKNAKEKLKNVINRYSFIFQQGNICDLCDWFPFLNEFEISLDVKTENALIGKASEVNNPIIWANILLYAKYYEPFFIDINSKVNEIIDTQISRISDKEFFLHKEFWYILVFYNCPYVDIKLRNKMSNIIKKITVYASNNPNPSSRATKIVCDFLEHKSKSGSMPKESFFNWKSTRGIGAQITYRTYQRTIFKRYRGNKYNLYASID